MNIHFSFLCLCGTSLPCYSEFEATSITYKKEKKKNFKLLPISISTCINVIIGFVVIYLPSSDTKLFFSPVLCRVNGKTKSSVLNQDFAAEFIYNNIFWAVEVEYLKIKLQLWSC